MNNIIYPKWPNFQIVCNLLSSIKLSATDLKIIAVAAMIFIIIAGLAIRIFKSMKLREVALPQLTSFNGERVCFELDMQTKIPSCLIFSEANCRFADILCPVATQVKIAGQNDEIYLHANHVSLEQLTFIAAQYPKVSQIPLFWRAASAASLVIDLTNDGDMKKGLQAYHPSLNEEISVAGLQIKCVSKQFFQNIPFPVYTYSVKGLAEDGVEVEPHQVARLHYEGWGDHQGITPDDLDQLLAVIEHYQKQSGLPVLIHCRAGVGRTGTLIVARAVKHLIDQGVINSPASLKEHLYRLVLEGRWQRGPSFVQTPPQMELIWTWGSRTLLKKGIPSPRLFLQSAH